MGGAKVSDKIKVIEKFVDIADTIVIGGAMANTFLKYKGHNMGASKVEADQEQVLDGIYSAAHKKLDTSIEDFINYIIIICFPFFCWNSRIIIQIINKLVNIIGHYKK
jgi:3-phosphoglycerate kinase